MISGLFIFFTSVAFILAIVGYLLSNEVMMTVGFLMFAFMSFPLLNQSLEYKSGETINLIQDNNSLICTNQLINSTEIYVYGNYFDDYHGMVTI